MAYKSYEDELSEKFLSALPTPLHHERPKNYDGLHVFWSQEDQPADHEIQNNNDDSFLGSVNTRKMISSMIKSALMHNNGDFEYRPMCIIQFWAPVMTNSGRCLSTSGQPFAVNRLNTDVSRYRSTCMYYQYRIDKQIPRDKPQPPTVSAFLNRFPVFVKLENRRWAEIPSMKSSFICGLEYSYLLPISFPTQNPSRRCIGVVEISASDILPNHTIVEMITALEKKGLFVFQIQERIPNQIKDGLIPACEEIEQALKVVCESETISLAQVWIAFENDKHVPCSSSLEGKQKQHMLSLKLTGYLRDMPPRDMPPRDMPDEVKLDYAEYYRFCDMFPLEMGENFVEKTLQDYTKSFCYDVSKLSDGTLVARLLKTFRIRYSFWKTSRIAICLNSTHTGDLCYAFEFIWETHPDFDVNEFEKVLTEVLRSFKPASGAKLGDKLDIINEGPPPREIRSPARNYLKSLYKFFHFCLL